MKPDRRAYGGLMCAGEVKQAVAYLQQFSQGEQMAARITRRMTGDKPVKRCKGAFVCRVDGCYQQYYRQVFWQECDHDAAIRALYQALCGVMETKAKPVTGDALITAMTNIEKKITAAMKKRHYYFLGGRTQGYYGPYIWKQMWPWHLDVLLPVGRQRFTVWMMDGFVSRGWLDFVSMGVSGTGGWQADETIYCVWKCYKNEIDKPSFQISFLKHEAQHAFDRAHYPNLTAEQLEYRAKLAELIYYPRLSLFYNILSEAKAYCGDDNSHAAASAKIVKALSESILKEEMLTDAVHWKGKLKLIKRECLRLYRTFESEYVKEAVK